MEWVDWLGGGWFEAENYEVARQVLQRGTAAIFLIAFVSTALQFPVLLGERGLLPVPQLLRSPYARRQPTLFRWRYSDRMLRGICVAGATAAASVVLGLPQLAPSWVPMLVFLGMWFAYLSIVNVGQTFYGFGWESLLLEAGFIVAFLGSSDVAPPFTVILAVRWLVFRLEFGAGMIKMRGDRSWRDLTALTYHHETQPMPNPVSRWAHLLPRWFHKLEVLGNHFAQLLVPFFLFAPQPVASVAALIIILTQSWLVVTGNFAWLNVITIVLAFSAVSDDAVRSLVPALPVFEHSPTPLWWAVPVLAATVLLVVLSWQPLRNLFSRNQLMNASFNRWHLVNAYGAFGSVTQRRFEIVIEGTVAENPAEEDWLPYEFKGKPGDPRRRPGQFAPYHLRLDWLMWFLALGSPGEHWFVPFLGRLLTADAATLRLLRRDPFDGAPPRAVRARRYLYRFATHREHRETGAYWIREEAGMFVPPVSVRANRSR
jgi:hypothetical protein